jgi:PadR family transcriptional regulator, regulatory protein PadR
LDVARRPDSSPQTLKLLAALRDDPARWRHGYDLARETGLKSGTLYPILLRLSDRGYLETRWEEEQPQGRPRRHLYRLTDSGAAWAATALAEAARRTTARAQPGETHPTPAKLRRLHPGEA